MSIHNVWLVINTFEELMQHEQEILTRIEKTPNGGNLFMLHPFMLLADIGVQLSNQAKQEILEQEPALNYLTETPYNALKGSQENQSVIFHMRGLFYRR